MTELYAELKRRNVFRVGIAYIVVCWLLLQAGDLLFEILEVPEWASKLLLAFLLLGFPLAIFFAWAFELTPDGIKRETEVDRSKSVTHKTGKKLDRLTIGVLAIAIGFLLFDRFYIDEGPPIVEPREALLGGSEPVELSIAVLPFVNMSADPGNEYFSDGISEELLNVLVKVDDLRVASRTSSFSLKGQNLSIPEIASRLGVNHILEGSVRKSGNTVRITAQLIDVSTDAHLWSDTYDRDLEDIFAVQTEISENIVAALTRTLVGEGAASIAVAPPTENLRAYELYLEGRFNWQLRNQAGLTRAQELFEQAIELDPDFARAWTGLASVYAVMPNWMYVDPAETRVLAAEAAKKAIELDDNQPEAHAILAYELEGELRWAESHDEYRKAIDRSPRQSNLHMWYAESLAYAGYASEALPYAQRAVELDPASSVANHVLGWIYKLTGDMDKAREHSETAMMQNPGGPAGTITLSYIAAEEGDTELAAQLEDDIFAPFTDLYSECFVAASGGEYAADLVERTRAVADPNKGADGFVKCFTGTGDYAGAADYLRQRVRVRSESLWEVWHDPTDFRSSAEFTELMEELNLVNYWRQKGSPDFCDVTADSVSCR